MAKKRRKHEEEKEEKEYKSPEFDEREFLEKEVLTGKITIAASIVSIPFAILVHLAVTPLGEDSAWLGLLIGILGILSLWFLLPAFGMNVKEMEPKHWFGPISTYLFTFLAVWVLLVNIPFSDHAGPQFITIEADIDGEVMTIIGVANNTTNKVKLSEITIASGSNLTINAKITDNDKMGSAATIKDNVEIPMVPDGADLYTCDLGAITDNTSITLVAQDSEGNNRTYEFQILMES